MTQDATDRCVFHEEASDLLGCQTSLARTRSIIACVPRASSRVHGNSAPVRRVATRFSNCEHVLTHPREPVDARGLALVQVYLRLAHEPSVERRGHPDQSLLALERDLLPRVQTGRGERAVAELTGRPGHGPGDLGPHVDAVLPADPRGELHRFGTRSEPCRTVGVHANVRDRPTTGLATVADVAHVRQVEAEHRIHVPQPADRALVHQGSNALPLRVVHDHVRLRREQTGPVTGSDQGVDLRRGHCDRLLCQNVLARL